MARAGRAARFAGCGRSQAARRTRFRPRHGRGAGVDKLLVETPAIKKRMLDIGVTGVAPERGTPEYLAKLVVDEIKRWEEPIKLAACRSIEAGRVRSASSCVLRPAAR